jgi:hypothetical protein
MGDLSQQRCFNHTSREAVARCPECRRCFCRECVTEHDDRVICAPCLRKLTATGETRKLRWQNAGLVLRFTLGFLTLFILFYCLGQILLLIPSSFHEGSLWQNLSLDPGGS